MEDRGEERKTGGKMLVAENRRFESGRRVLDYLEIKVSMCSALIPGGSLFPKGQL